MKETVIISYCNAASGDTIFVRQNGEQVDSEILDKFHITAANVYEEVSSNWKQSKEDLGTYYTNK